MLCRDAVDPAIEPAPAELDDSMAARANEVVVVLVPAQPVAELALVMRERVDDSGTCQRG